MASTGRNHGGVAKITVDGVVITFMTNCSMSVQRGTRDATTKDDTWAANKGGIPSWSMSAECLFAEDATFKFDTLMTGIVADTEFTVRYSSGVSGDKYYEGTARITSLENSGTTQNDNQVYSVQFTGDGALAPGTEA